MFKIAVFAFLAVAAAEPGALIAPGYSSLQYSTYLAPGAASIWPQNAGLIQPAPLGYYSGLPTAYTHFIKKREAEAPQQAPEETQQPEKRSVALFPSTYYGGQAYAAAPAPLLTTSYAAASPFYPASPYISQPLAYTHLIKKRSAPLLNAYVAPAAYSTQSRFDLKTSYPFSSYSPVVYTNPYPYTHVY